MKPQGYWNFLIQEAIDAGMTYENGGLVNVPPGFSKPGYHQGYFKISFRRGRMRATFNLARIVCWLVNGPPPTPGHQVDHINRIKTDDSPENLRWVTHRENTQNISEEDKVARLAMLDSRLKRGIESKYCKLTETQVAEIRASKEISRILADRFGVRRATISRIKRGDRWKHLPGLEPAPPREWIFEVFEVGYTEPKAFAWSPRTASRHLSTLRQKHPESLFRVAKRKLSPSSPES